MFCENCGKPNEDGAMFCEHCGAKIGADTPVTAPAATAATAAPKFTPMDFVKKIHQKNKFILPVVAGVLVLAVVLIIVFSILGKQVAMQDYLKVEFVGYNGFGRVQADFDEDSFGMRCLGYKDYKQHGDFNEESMTPAEQRQLAQAFMKHQAFFETIDKEVIYPEGKENGNLSNGDKITVVLTCDTELGSKMGVTIETGTYEYEVSGLAEPQKINILEYFGITATGYDGHGEAELVCPVEDKSVTVGAMTFEFEADSRYIYAHNEEGYSYHFYVYVESDTYDLSNGDTVKVKVDAEADYLARFGVVLEGLEKDFSITELKEAETLDLADVIKLTFSGYNGFGAMTFDENAPAVEVGDMNFSIYQSWGSYYLSVTSDTNGFGWDYRIRLYYNDDSLDSDDYMTNGMVITAKVELEEDSFSYYGVKLENTSVEFTVSGLSELNTFDPFANLRYYLTGVSGSAKLTLGYKEATVKVGDLVFDYENGKVLHNDEKIANLSFSLRNNSYLEVGNMATISISYNANTLGKYGVKISQDSVTYTVTQVGEYVEDVALVESSSNYNDLLENAEAKVTEELMDNWNRFIHDKSYGDYADKSMTDLTLYSIILTEDHYLFFVFTATVDDASMEPATVFLLCRYTYAVLNPDNYLSYNACSGYFTPMDSIDEIKDRHLRYETIVSEKLFN